MQSAQLTPAEQTLRELEEQQSAMQKILKETEAALQTLPKKIEITDLHSGSNEFSRNNLESYFTFLRSWKAYHGMAIVNYKSYNSYLSHAEKNSDQYRQYNDTANASKENANNYAKEFNDTVKKFNLLFADLKKRLENPTPNEHKAENLFAQKVNEFQTLKNENTKLQEQLNNAKEEIAALKKQLAASEQQSSPPMTLYK